MKSLHFFSLLFLLFSSLSAFSQSGVSKGDIVRDYRRSPTIDRSVLECIYSHKVYDPHFARTEERFWILEDGKNYSKYWSHSKYRVDSVVVNHLSCRVSRKQLNMLQRKYDVSIDPYVIKNKVASVLTYMQPMFMEYHLYEEPIPKFEWQLVSGTDTVCGYVCRKAVCDFRGRQWTAWYSEIPHVNGPWKFEGLPGLILRVEDSKKEHVFEAVAVRKSDKEITYNFNSKDRERTTREKFNKMYNEYRTNTRVFLTGSNLPIEGSPQFVERTFYNAIETSDLE
ncbi:MAG: GLPGLI family protein [Staphylococcus sp.]|nr:GLPGLI family protein [Staphylococcus sp.]